MNQAAKIIGFRTKLTFQWNALINLHVAFLENVARHCAYLVPVLDYVIVCRVS